MCKNKRENRKEFIMLVNDFLFFLKDMTYTKTTKEQSIQKISYNDNYNV